MFKFEHDKKTLSISFSEIDVRVSFCRAYFYSSVKYVMSGSRPICNRMQHNADYVVMRKDFYEEKLFVSLLLVEFFFSNH